MYEGFKHYIEEVCQSQLLNHWVVDLADQFAKDRDPFGHWQAIDEFLVRTGGLRRVVHIFNLNAGWRSFLSIVFLSRSFWRARPSTELDGSNAEMRLNHSDFVINHGPISLDLFLQREHHDD